MSLRLIANSACTVTVTIKVRNSAGTLVPYDISAATEIQWLMNTTRTETTPTLSVTKTGGDIAFVGTGEDGQYEFSLSATDVDDSEATYWSRSIVTIGGEPYRSKWVQVEFSS